MNLGHFETASFAQLHPLHPPSPPPPLGLGRKRDEASRHYNFRGVVRKLLFRQSDDSGSYVVMYMYAIVTQLQIMDNSLASFCFRHQYIVGCVHR